MEYWNFALFRPDQLVGEFRLLVDIGLLMKQEDVEGELRETQRLGAEIEKRTGYSVRFMQFSWANRTADVYLA